jgi:pimeloyl-ACP methyl ester carboxylesterase
MSGQPGFVDVEDLRLAYLREGPPGAPAVILLHGWASSSRMWHSTQAALAGAFDTVAIDLPGHGTSAKPPWEWYTIDRFTLAVQQVCQALGLSRASFVGHSMGGTIALELAAAGRMGVGRLVLVNPVVSGQVNQFARGPIREGWIRPVVRVSRRLWPVASRLLTRPPAAVRSRLPGHVIRNQEDLAQTTADSAIGSIQAVLNWDVRGRLADIHVPTLVIVGDADRTVSPREGLMASEHIEGSRLWRFAGGHNPSDEDPGAFEATLASFLAPERNVRV